MTLRILITLIAISLFAAACADTGPETGAATDLVVTNDPALTGTGEATLEPAAGSAGQNPGAQDPQTASGDASLTQAVTSSDGSLTVSYPEGWFAQPQTGLIVLSTEEGLASGAVTQPEAGEGVISVYSIPGNQLAGEQLALTDILNQFGTQLTAQGADATQQSFSEAREFTINERPAASIQSTADVTEQLFVIVDLGDGNYALATLTGAPGIIATHSAVAETVAGSVIYDPNSSGTPGEFGGASGTAEGSGAGTVPTLEGSIVPTLNTTPEGSTSPGQ